MTDQHTPDGNDINSPAGNADAFGWSAMPSTPDPTQPLTPLQQPAFPTAATAPVRRSGGLAASVLIGALLLGGGAGVGGAAWYDAWNGDDNGAAAPASTGSIRATNAAAAPAGSVEKVASTVLPSVVKINVSGGSGAGSGSGIILKGDGTILTNNHVVSLAGNGGAITVNFNDGKTVKATVVGTDPVTDMAVIKAEGVSGLTPATIGKSGDLLVGQAVVAVGSPYGLNSTVTSGIVSALNRPVSVQTDDQLPLASSSGSSTTYPAIQTDAAINPGNSGGALVDMSGRVVGVNSSIRTADGSGLSSSSGGSIGLGFAIPIDEVLPIVNQIIDGQTPTHARLAVVVAGVTADTLAQGALIRSADSGGAADKAGLKQGDVITKVDDEPIDGAESLIATIRGHRPGETVTITYLRNGKTQTVKATLGSDEKSAQS